MAVTFIANALGGTTTTTTFSITLPTTAAGDILILEYTHRATADATIGGTYTGGTFLEKHDQLYATSTFSGKTLWSRCTGNHSGQTVTGSGLTDSCAAIITQYRGALAAGDPLQAATVVGEQNASGNETQAAITTLTANAWVVLVVVNSPDLAVTTQACTSPGTLTARAERLSTGGTDTSIAHASAEKAAAGATGAFTWAQTDAASGSWAYAIYPEPTPGTDVIGAAEYTVGTHRADYAAAQNRTWVHGTPPPLFGVTPIALSADGGALLLAGGTALLESTTTTRLRRHFFVGEQDAGRLRAGRAVVYGLAVAALAGVPVSLDATGGALTLTGGTATLSHTESLTATGGALVLSGGTATLAATSHVTLTATGGALVLTGGTATLQTTGHVVLPATGGALLLSGGTATLAATAGTSLTATGAALLLTGTSATSDRGLTATGGALLLSGGTASLTTAWSLPCTGGALVLTGGTATLSHTANATLAATGGALLLSGGTATLEYTSGTTLGATGGALLLTGGTATTAATHNAFVIGTGGALVLSGTTAARLDQAIGTASGGALILSGGTASLDKTGHVILVGTGGHLLLSGTAATLSHTQSLDGTGGALLLTGTSAATLSHTANAHLEATGGQLILTGGTAALVAVGSFELTASPGLLLLSGTTTATLVLGEPIPPPLVATGPGPGVPLVDRRQGVIELIDQDDWVTVAIIITEILNAERR